VDSPLVLDLWADVVCPYCYLARHQLAEALSRFDHAEHVLVRHHAFELDPAAPLASEQRVADMLAEKYAISLEQVAEMHARLEAQAATHGLSWSLAGTRSANTFDAHRLVALAATQGRVEEMLELLYHAHFSEGHLLSDHDTLSQLAQDAGVEGADDLWQNDAFAADVRADEARAASLGLRGVPALVLDSTFLVSGAQGADAFADALHRAWNRRQS
jgi:predicted DsbA family dithiol-disulfide isomerase